MNTVQSGGGGGGGGGYRNGKGGTGGGLDLWEVGLVWLGNFLINIFWRKQTQ